MDHDTKMGVADDIGRRILARFGDEVLFGTLSGSVARKEDTEHSDLEVVFITRNRVRFPGMSPDGYREFLLKDLQTQIEFRSKQEALDHLAHVGPYWPFQVWFLLEPVVFCGEPGVIDSTVAEFRRCVSDLPAEAFRKAAGQALLWVRGHLGKVRNAFEEGDDARTGQVSEWMGYEAAGFVALVNRRYYKRSDLRWLKESDSFPLLPERYRDLMTRLHTARDRGTILETAQRLYSACDALAMSHGIETERLQTLEELEF